MKHFRWIIIFFCILGLATFVRMWNLGTIPEGFYSDEALYGYEAYSLFKTGKDEFGNKLPLSIAGFGDYRPAYYIYATIPFIATLGLTEFATRLPSAVSSIATLVVLFFFVQAITKNKRVALLATLLLAVSPWGIFFGRMAHETNLMTLLVLAGTFFLWRAKNCRFCLFPAICLYAASLYTYHTARVFVPLFLLLTGIVYFRDYRRQLKLGLIGLFFFLILLLPLAAEFSWEGSWSRVKGIGIWSDIGVIGRINSWRGGLEKSGASHFFSWALVNKATMYPLVFMEKFMSHFDARFLLLWGDPNGVYNTPYVGIVLWLEIILIPVGAAVLWRKNRRLFYWTLGAIVIGLIPDSLTRTAPSSARIHVVLPFITFLSAVGLNRLLVQKKIWVTWGIYLFLVFNSWWFWYNYLTVRPVVQARAWQYGVKEMIQKAQILSPQYDHIWISRTGWGWIHILFHTKYDPATFQKEAKVSPRNELGFWWVSDVGKYHLDWLPGELTSDKDHTLYIGEPIEFASGTIPKDHVQNQFGRDAYWFVDVRN